VRCLVKGCLLAELPWAVPAHASNRPGQSDTVHATQPSAHACVPAASRVVTTRSSRHCARAAGHLAALRQGLPGQTPQSGQELARHAPLCCLGQWPCGRGWANLLAMRACAVPISGVTTVPVISPSAQQPVRLRASMADEHKVGVGLPVLQRTVADHYDAHADSSMPSHVVRSS
jgi:hypothetical protein